MATATTITQALARLRADRPGLGLEDAIDAHWIDWFAGPEFPDEELFAGVNYYIETHPARTWPTVAEVELAIKEVLKVYREAGELEAGPCAYDCLDGFVYRERKRPGDPFVLVPCECSKGLAKRKALEAWESNRRARARARGEGGNR